MPNYLEFLRDDRGQGLVEYALIIALVALAAIAGMTFLGKKARNSINNSALLAPGS